MDAIPPSELGPVLTTAGIQIIAQKYAMVACHAVLVYDYFLTLGDEVRYIWKRQFSLVSLIFFINRYFAMLTLFLLIVENASTVIGASGFGDGIPLTVITNFVIGLRVYALYKRNTYIAMILGTYIIAELAVVLWINLTPSITPVTAPGPPSANEVPVLHLCLVSSSPRITPLQSAVFPVMQVIYDSIAFGMIAFKTAAVIWNERGQYKDVRALLVKNGLLYFALVFSLYFTWVMMTLFCPPSLQRAAEAPAIILTCVSINRLTLSLRAFTDDDADDTTINQSGIVFGRPVLRRRRSWVGTSTFEVGEDTTYAQRSLGTFHDSEAQEMRRGRRTEGRTGFIPDVAYAT